MHSKKNNLYKCKRGEAVSGSVFKWIISLALIIIAGFAIKNVVLKYAS